LALPGAQTTTLSMPRLPDLRKGGGFTIELRIELATASADRVLLDTRDSSGEGIALATTDRGTIRIDLSDGKTKASWDADPGLLKPGHPHHVVSIVDGGPKIITFVVDGVLCDGGTHRQYGWGRFPPELSDVNGRKQIETTLPPSEGSLRIYDRALRTTEAVANYHALRATGTPSP
jgi:hypothetical protein